jgi:hypothetical protein
MCDDFAHLHTLQLYRLDVLGHLAGAIGCLVCGVL